MHFYQSLDMNRTEGKDILYSILIASSTVLNAMLMDEKMVGSFLLSIQGIFNSSWQTILKGVAIT